MMTVIVITMIVILYSNYQGDNKVSWSREVEFKKNEISRHVADENISCDNYHEHFVNSLFKLSVVSSGRASLGQSDGYDSD